MDKYSFSRDEGGIAVGVMVSEELNGRLMILCNLLEMSRSSLVRYLVTRGTDELEAKLVDRAIEFKKRSKE